MKSAILIVTLLVTLITSLIGQDPFFINFTIDDGLPSNEVYDVEIDNDGVVWFTTDRGVSSYDSYEFTNYTTFDGLQDNVNFEIFKDSSGTLWFFGYNGKITLYESGNFKPYEYNDELINLSKPVYGVYIKEIQQTDKNTLLISYDLQKGACIFSIYKDKKPIRTCKSNSPQKIKINEFTFSFSLKASNQNGTTPISYKTEIEEFISEIDIASNVNFFYEKRSKILFSDISVNGLQMYDCESRQIDTILREYKITDVKSDQNNNYWLSTTTSGVLLISNININTLDTNTKSISAKDNFMKLHVFANKLFCGVSDNKLITINTFNKVDQIPLLSHTYTKPNIDQFQTINQGKNLIFTGYNAEIVEDSFVLNESQIMKRLFYLSNGKIALRTMNQIKIHSDINLSDTILINLNQNPSIITESPNSEIWIGTLGELYKIENFNFSNFQEIKVNNNDKTGRISDITFDALNNTWISTIGNGIFMINSRDTIHFNTSNGLTTNIVNTVEVTDTNNVWVGTNNGLNLLHYNYSTDSIQFIESFDKSDGLNTSYINDIIEWNNRIYIASPNGICTFPADKIRKKNTEVPLKINSVYVNDSLIHQRDLKELSYDQNQITIDFRAIRHGKSEYQKLYKYKLERNTEKRDWIYTNDKEAIYDNLRHGDYIFTVNAVNKIGEWNKNAEKLKFSIRPHYTDTVWFKVLLFIGSIIITLLTSLYFIRRYKKTKATELELEEVKRKSKEAELSALRNQMNPHFIFNSLNTIQNFVFKKDVKKANFLLTKFSSLIRRSLNYSRLDSISILEELEFLKDYVELEKVRFPDLITLEFNIDEIIDISSERIPTLLLQPLVENSIKHGISKSKQDGIIQINITALENDYLQILISDIGMPPNTKKTTASSHISLGQQIINDRIAILRQNGFPNASFEIKNVSEIGNCNYQVKLVLPKL